MRAVVSLAERVRRLVESLVIVDVVLQTPDVAPSEGAGGVTLGEQAGEQLVLAVRVRWGGYREF